MFNDALKTGFNLGQMIQGIGFSFVVGATFTVENGFLVVSQRLESFQVEQPKRKFYPMGLPLSGEGWKGEDEPEMETVTKHAVRVVTTFCPDLKAVTEALVVANAEREKILKWQRDQRSKDTGDYVCAYR
jgi:hypothetical protein